MTNNPLTAAALGLKIGLLLCLLLGCEQPEPTPADTDRVQEAIEKLPLPPTPVAEHSVVTPAVDVPAFNELCGKVASLESRIQPLEAHCSSDHEIISNLGQLNDVVCSLRDRVKKLEDKPDCCMMPGGTKSPEMTPDHPKTPENKDGAHGDQKPTGNLMDDAEQRSTDDGQKLIFLLTKDGCSRCAAFKAHVVTDSFMPAIDGNLHYQEVNTSRHPGAADRFDIPAGTLLPIAILWNPATKTFHQIPAEPGQSLGDFLSELNLPQDAAPPRRRLLNFRKD